MIDFWIYCAVLTYKFPIKQLGPHIISIYEEPSNMEWIFNLQNGNIYYSFGTDKDITYISNLNGKFIGIERWHE